MIKKEIRNSVYEARKRISDIEYVRLNSNIFKAMITCDKLMKVIGDRPVFIYSSLKGEADTVEIAKYFLDKGNVIAYPKVTDKANKRMGFYSIKDFGELKTGYLGILEPETDVSADELAGNAVMIIPMVGFDENLNRIGYGGGFYDRYMMENFPFIKIGLAFEFQKYKIDDINEYDIKMDYIITEKDIYGGSYERF
ncbi:MAG: 5-formyltetrahydrofolate cyclo-ligase [Lachnospiraceae bacterium]|nr:5-formyltetrahydrofolate cyclo-ligase [Lachnospiraceae bacterium]